MRVIPAIDGLMEFRPDGSAPVASAPLALDPGSEPQPEPDIGPTVEAPELISRDALEAAAMVARQETEAVWSQRLEEAKIAAEDLLERERAGSLAAAAEAIADGIAEQFELMRQNLAQQILTECRPVLSNLARERALDELQQVADTVIGGSCRLRIAGPQSLLDELRPRLEKRSVEIDWCPEDSTEVSIAAGDTIVVSRLTDWLNRQANPCDE